MAAVSIISFTTRLPVDPNHQVTPDQQNVVGFFCGRQLDFRPSIIYSLAEPAATLNYKHSSHSTRPSHEARYRVRLKWKPFQLRLKGKGERSQYSEYKVKYSYMDVAALGEHVGRSENPRPERGASFVYSTKRRYAIQNGLFSLRYESQRVIPMLRKVASPKPSSSRPERA